MEVNKELLKKLVKQIGKESVAVRAECSASTIEKLIAGSYRSAINPHLRKRLSDALNIEQDVLFPPDPEKESA